MKKILDFLQYNNASIIILMMAFVVGSATFASETGQEIIGERSVEIRGEDNSVLIETDLESVDFEFQIENITEDEKFVYVTYTYRPLERDNGVWKFITTEKVMRVSQKAMNKRNFDLERYVVREFKQMNESLVSQLEIAQDAAKQIGKQERVEVVEYSGLRGAVLDLVSQEGARREKVLVSRSVLHESKHQVKDEMEGNVVSSGADNLTEIYNEWVLENGDKITEITGDTETTEIINPPSPELRRDEEQDTNNDNEEEDTSNKIQDTNNDELDINNDNDEKDTNSKEQDIGNKIQDTNNDELDINNDNDEKDTNFDEQDTSNKQQDTNNDELDINNDNDEEDTNFDEQDTSNKIQDTNNDEEDTNFDEQDTSDNPEHLGTGTQDTVKKDVDDEVVVDDGNSNRLE